MNVTPEQIEAMYGTLQTLVNGLDEGQDDATIRNYIAIQVRAVVNELSEQEAEDGKEMDDYLKDQQAE